MAFRWSPMLNRQRWTQSVDGGSGAAMTATNSLRVIRGSGVPAGIKLQCAFCSTSLLIDAATSLA